jgi:hypothetical protein
VSDAWLKRAQGATIRIDGGCTGSFASPDGLVLTNNHCVWRCVRHLSSSEHNLSEEGFLARDRSEERVCPGERVSVLQETEDVTVKVEEAIAGMEGAAANEARNLVLTRLEAACEEKSGLACESVSLYGGGQYHLYKYTRYDDVRLVFAPEMPIAAFGGDPDNFQFPRWCLDMSFLRVYENGQPASTPNHFRWRTEDFEAGEPVFVAGHPGSTQRLLTVAQLRRLRDVELPRRLLIGSELRGRMVEWGKRGKEESRIIQQRLLGVENGLKVRRNQLFSLLNEQRFGRKAAQEEELREAVEADDTLRRLYGSSWQEIENAQRVYDGIAEAYENIERAQAFNSTLFGYARTLVRAAAELPKPSEKRLREYRETLVPRIKQRLLAPIPISLDYQRLTLTFSLEKMLEWLGPDHEWVKRVLGRESGQQLAERLVSGTGLADTDRRRELWEGGEEAVAQSNDPMIELALKIDAGSRELRKRYEDEVQATTRLASEKIGRARFAVLGSGVYPDATFSLRVSWGSVAGWEEKGAKITPFTEIARLYERATGADPFRLPQSWVDARPHLNLDTRFNFTANTDIIGGNSGSPMIDRDGNLVGLVFDGNIHSISGSYWFDESRNRTIAVHPAVMVEALREVYEAAELLEELGLDEDTFRTRSSP